MASGRRNDTCATPNPYEEHRNRRLAIIDAKMQELGIHRLAEELNQQPKKRKVQ
jgi:hypothetical protein